VIDLNGFPTALWFEMPREGGSDPKLAQAISATVRDIERRQVFIHEGNKRHARIYAGYLPSSYVGASVRAPFAATKAVIRSICDIAHAMIVRNRPKSTFVTDGADFEVQQAAEDMDQFLVGAYNVGGLYEVAPRSFHDSTILGTGGWKLVQKGSGEKFHVVYRRVQMDDVIVDEDECREDMVPENLYQRTVVRTDQLIKRYASGSDKESVERRSRLLATANTNEWPNLQLPRDRTVLIEAYHVSEQGENRRVLMASDVVLEDKPWPFDFHPYEFLYWNLPQSGFYGDGIAYRQFGRQERITYLHKWIQKVLDLYGTPTAWIDPAGGPPTLQMSNDIGKIVSARRPPVFQNQQIVPPEVYQWLDKLEADGRSDEGISDYMAQNQLQPGIESAPAQRELSYKEGQRFAPVSQRWENAIGVSTARKTVAMYRHHAKNHDAPRVKWADRRLMYDIQWPDLAEDAYMIRPEASNLDSLSPSARAQSVLELAQTGWITPLQGRALVAIPDLRESDELDTAPFTYAKWVLRKLRRLEAVMIDEKADLAVLQDVVSKGRLLAITKSAPDLVVAHMDRFLESLDTAVKAAQDAAMQEAAMQQAAMQPQPAMSGPSGEGRPVPFASSKTTGY
jgi:hypothetical protein